MTLPDKPSVMIIGAGPAGLMAAERLARHGLSVSVFDHMPSPGRKFLMAGRGGLNLTHEEDFLSLIEHYSTAKEFLSPALKHFPPEALRVWAHELGIPTFVGTSNRVFPKCMKASPLLRAWLNRLQALNVQFYFHHKWIGWDADQNHIFIYQEKHVSKKADAALLALGGASWPRLGSDGSFVPLLLERGLSLSPLEPANCGFIVPWSRYFSERHQGQPLKSISLSFDALSMKGECMITSQGLEGGVIYSLSKRIRETLKAKESVTLILDLKPTMTKDEIIIRLSRPRKSQSMSTYLKKSLGLSPASIGLLYEVYKNEELKAAELKDLANKLKTVPIKLTAPSPLTRSISTAGGLSLTELTKDYMIKKLPGTFAAGEMLDWEAPTGGYLLQATLSTAVFAALGMITWLEKR